MPTDSPVESPPVFRRRAVARSAAVVAVIVGAAAIAFPLAAHLTAVDPRALRPVAPPPPASTSPTPAPLQEVGSLALSRTVTVEADRTNEEALGTAWLFDARGDFVTNAHVLTGQLTVRLGDRTGHTHPATVLGTDDSADIALVRSGDGFPGAPLPQRARPLRPLPIPVVDLASGRATGHDDITGASLTRSGQDVPLQPGEVPAGGNAPSVYHDMLAVSGARVYQGNSGGPVLDQSGQVLGILTLASPDQPEAYAIPLQRVAGELKEFAARSG